MINTGKGCWKSELSAGDPVPNYINTLKAYLYLNVGLQVGDLAEYPEGHFLVLSVF